MARKVSSMTELLDVVREIAAPDPRECAEHARLMEIGGVKELRHRSRELNDLYPVATGALDSVLEEFRNDMNKLFWNTTRYLQLAPASLQDYAYDSLEGHIRIALAVAQDEHTRITEELHGKEAQ